MKTTQKQKAPAARDCRGFILLSLGQLRVGGDDVSHALFDVGLDLVKLFL